MFTGIVESVGTVLAVDSQGEKSRIRIEAPSLHEAVELGDSVAVNGACLTVASIESEALGFDAVAETLEKTALGELQPGSRVNLERALRAGGRLDGHIVQGHVDGVGRVAELRRQGDDVRLDVACEAGFADWLVPKGSVAIQGVSLTVVEVRSSGFDVALIPYTLELTTLGELRAGDPVNLEADVLGKYVKRYLDRLMPSRNEPSPR